MGILVFTYLRTTGLSTRNSVLVTDGIEVLVWEGFAPSPGHR
jgi:hypothetical protein